MANFNTIIAKNIIEELKAKKKADTSAKLVFIQPIELKGNLVLEARLLTLTGICQLFVSRLDKDGSIIHSAVAEKPSEAIREIEDILSCFPR